MPAASKPSINIRMSFFPNSFAKAFPIFVVQTAHTDGPAGRLGGHKKGASHTQVLQCPASACTILTHIYNKDTSSMDEKLYIHAHYITVIVFVITIEF